LEEKGMNKSERKVIDDAYDMASDTLLELRAILSAMKHVNISNMNDKVTAMDVLLEGAYLRTDAMEENLRDVAVLTMQKYI